MGQMKEGERIKQRTRVQNPQTQTTVWRWSEGLRRGEGWVEMGKGGGMGTSVKVSTIKMKKIHTKN